MKLNQCGTNHVGPMLIQFQGPKLIIDGVLFLAVQNSSIGDLVTDSLTHWLSHSLLLLTYKERPERDLWPLRHLIRVMRKHDLTKKRQRQRKRLRQLQMHLENTFKERSLRPLTSGIIGENSASQSIILAWLGLLTINRIYSALLSSCSKAAHIKDNLELWLMFVEIRQ